MKKKKIFLRVTIYIAKEYQMPGINMLIIIIVIAILVLFYIFKITSCLKPSVLNVILVFRMLTKEKNHYNIYCRS